MGDDRSILGYFEQGVTDRRRSMKSLALRIPKLRWSVLVLGNLTPNTQSTATLIQRRYARRSVRVIAELGVIHGAEPLAMPNAAAA